MTSAGQQDTVVVVSETPTELTVSQVNYQLTVAAPGPQGRPGADGDAYDFRQSSPSASWLINHGLNKRPSVTVYNEAGQIVYPDVEYVDANNVAIVYPSPDTGYAHLV